MVSMKRKQMVFGFLSLALCAAMLFGCGTAEQTGEAEESPEAVGNADAGVQQDADLAADYDEAALVQALDDCADIAPGSSGCSLRAIRAAGELVSFAALNWTDQTSGAIRERVSAWAQALDEGTAAELREGWDLISDQAAAIAETPQATDILNGLEDAGLGTLDLSGKDLSHTGDLLSCIREAIGAEAAA